MVSSYGIPIFKVTTTIQDYITSNCNDTVINSDNFEHFLLFLQKTYSTSLPMGTKTYIFLQKKNINKIKKRKKKILKTP